MYLSDMHTHSIASGHGTRSTINDMARSASEKGLRLLGITDHGPATVDAGTSSYFRSLAFSPRERFGVELLFGVELNIMDTEGHVDLEEELISRLDYAIVSMHWHNFPSRSKEENTLAFLNAMQHPRVRILGHADNTNYPVDYRRLAEECLKTSTIFEINEASLAPYGYRGDTRNNCREILSCCRSLGLPILLSSDSHGPSHVGDFTYASRFVNEQLFPKELILNNHIPALKRFLLEGKLPETSKCKG